MFHSHKTVVRSSSLIQYSASCIVSCPTEWTAGRHGNISHAWLPLRVMTPRHYCTLHVWELVRVRVRVRAWRSAQQCVDSFVWSHESLGRPQAFCIRLWLHAHLFMNSLHLCVSLTPSLRVQVRVRERGQQADTHYQQVQPVWWRSVRVRGRGREELHGGFRQRYMNHCLEESFFQQAECFFFLFFSFSFLKYLIVKRPDSSVPSSCLCLSSVYFAAFKPAQYNAAPCCLLTHF